MSEKVSEGGRQRIIKDVETLDQAVKAEKDVESGYHGVIDENISYWLAVEEDIIESYTKLVKNSKNRTIKVTLNKIIADSKNHVRMLTSIRKAFNKIMADEHRHAALLQELADKFHK
jgi:rubrerythrin